MINNNVFKTVSLGILFLLLSHGAAAEGLSSDTLNIRFRLDSIRVDMGYADNARAWSVFEEKFQKRYAEAPSHLLRLDIFSGASPEGSAAHNRWLGENRGVAIRRFVRQQLGDRLGAVIVHNEAARWDGLYEAVAASSEPWRDEVLRIIEQPASSNENLRDHRESQLRALRGGSVWPVLLEHYLAPLRSGASAVLSWIAAPGGRDTIVVRDTIIMAQPIYIRCDSITPPIEQVEQPKPVLRQPVWILRSNIPLLGTGTPNLQAEWSLDHKDRWSINVEGVWSWWTFSYNAYANEIIYGSVEFRRYLGRRYRHHTLGGWHIGLGLGGGYGDLEWRSKGYQAEVYSAFVNIGWQYRFGRRKQWAFDAGIGIGYAYVPWRRYDGSTLFPIGHEEVHDDHLMWRETGHTNWPGVNHLNISLGYVFNQKDAAWKRLQANERDIERNAYLHYRDSVHARKLYVRDSIKTADKLRLKEIDLLPKAERKQALASYKAEKKQAKLEKKLAQKQAAEEKKLQKQREREEAKLRKQQERDEKAARKEQLRKEKEYYNTPEGKEALKQKKLEEKAARKQAKQEQKLAKQQEKLQRKQEKMRKRIELEHQRNLEKYQIEIEKADKKYNSIN